MRNNDMDGEGGKPSKFLERAETPIPCSGKPDETSEPLLSLGLARSTIVL